MKTHLKLSNGAEMPILVMACGNENASELEAALDFALDAGYRHFDSAFAYQNETVLGNVMKRWFSSGKVKREDLFIVTKLPIHGVHHDRVEKFMVESLKRLQLEYVDLYLIHNPAGIKADGWNIQFTETGEVIPDLTTTLENVWKAMEAQATAGRTKAIGISNFSIAQVERLAKCATIMPANLQVELNANYPKKPLRDTCAKYGITVCAFAPLGSPGRKTYYEKLPADSPLAKANIPNLIGNPIVTAVAKTHGKTAAQVLLRFLAQQDIAVIPKSVTPSRIKENFDIFSFELDVDDMAKLHTLRIDDEGTWGFDWSGGLPGLLEHPEFQISMGQ